MAIWRLIFKLNLLLLATLAFKAYGSTRQNELMKQFLASYDQAHEEKEDGTKWAVLVAGSNEYMNYRHQADVCHAYQILKRGGLKDENIVVFMYDDIAMHKDNPRRGVIINHPHGSDVYAGVPKDYTGENVTVDNFYAVLLGNKEAVKGGSGKVVDSKPNDMIFIYYSDHGGAGILSMPNPPMLYAKDFIEVLKKKHAARTYKGMVIYVEACEAGSIFEGLLPENLNIYVTTASNANESSWATYCPDMDSSVPPEFEPCLGDLYSVAWMENSEAEYGMSQTLKQQYEKVKERTYNNGEDRGSHVMKYGQKSIQTQLVSLYQGNAELNFSTGSLNFKEPVAVVNQRDADLTYLYWKYIRSTEGSEQKAKNLMEMTDVLSHRMHLDRSVTMIGENLFGKEESPLILDSVRSQGLPLVDDWDCLKSNIRTFETHCGILTPYGMKYTRAFANICNNNVIEDAMEEAIAAACRGYNLGKWNPMNVGFSA